MFRDLLSAKRQGSPDADGSVPLTRAELDLALELFHDYENCGLGFFWASDAQGRLTYVSDSVARQLGKTRHELAGQELQELFELEPDDERSSQRTLPLILKSHKTFSQLVVRQHGGYGEYHWSISGRPQLSKSGDFLGYRGNGSDVSEAYRSKQDASRLASFDTLTGLSNRHRITKKLDTFLAAAAHNQRSCAVMMIDLDRFKQVNDTLGHPAGDALLRQVSERLRPLIKEPGEIGRLGGDEFQIVLPDIDDRGELGELAKKIIAVVSQPYTLQEGRCIIGASVGVAIAPYDGIEREALLRAADLALYAAKGGGRGQFRFYSADMLEESERRRQIEADLRSALERDEMKLAYEPQLDATNKVVALQASLVWDHPDFDEIPPHIFMPIAYETNQIGALNDWALRRACEDAVHWPGNVKVAVKVCPSQFASQNFPALVTQALAQSELDPERLELELPETVFYNDGEIVDNQVVALRMLGVQFVLDGFGEGQSSLDNLRKAPFDKIKIAPTFVQGLTEPLNPNKAFVRTIVTLARDLGMTILAEGVEAHDELNMVRELGADQVQGEIFAGPVRYDDVIEAMQTGTWLIEPSGPSRFRDTRRSVLRKVGLIHEDFRYEVRMRNLSRTGCLVDGLVDVPVGTQFVVDFGSGQLAVADVKRSAGHQQGLEFEIPLVDDGAGGLVTRHRVSPYALAAAGMPLGALPPGSYPLALNPASKDAFHAPAFAQAE